MPTDFRVVLPNRPGSLVRACEAVARASVNVDAFCGDLRPGESWGYLHLLVSDPGAARQALEEAGLEITSEHEVEVLEVEDRPGALVEAVRGYSESGRNIEVIYIYKDGRVVVGTEDMQKPRLGVRTSEALY